MPRTLLLMRAALGMCMALVVGATGACWPQPPQPAVRHPSLYLDKTDVDAIRQRIQEQPEARSTFQALLQDCERHLTLKAQAPQGIFKASPAGVLGDEGPDQPEPSHLELARQQGGAARDLGLAYVLTGNKAYATKAANLIMPWARSLEPKVPQHDYRAWHEMVRGLPAFFYAADLIYDSQAFSDEDLAALRQWAANLATAEREVHIKATVVITAYSLNLVWCCGVIADDPQQFVWATDSPDNQDTYAYLIGELFEPTGEVRKDYFRGPLRTIVEVPKGFVLVAEAARHQGYNLYDVERNGRSLKKVLLFHARYLDGTDTTLQSPFLGAEPDWSAYQLAAAYWADPAFRKVLAYQKRPAFDPDVLGPVSLTHPAKL